MNAFDELSRRDFLDRSLRLGAAGLAASCTSCSNPAAKKAADRWQIGCYTRPWAKYDYRVALDAIAEAGLSPEDIGLIVSHAMGDPVIDLAEREALSGPMAEVPMIAPIASLGHTGAASGQLGLVVGAMALDLG